MLSRIIAGIGVAVVVAWIMGLNAEPGASVAHADIHHVPNKTGALVGKTVVISAGHGSNDSGSWDRGVLHNLREDIHTNELVTVWLQRFLTNAGARVFTVRERSFMEHEIIVDNTDAGYSDTGNWTSSTSATDFYGANYRVHPVTTAGGNHGIATWTPDLPMAGDYPVYVWWAPGSNRNASATYTVHHPGGSSPVTIDQQLYRGSWIYLGTWHFEAGQNPATGSVSLSSAGTDSAQYSIADAVRFGGGKNPVTNYALWKDEAAVFLTRHIGFPNAGGSGDVTIRPTYAGWLTNLTGTNWNTQWRYLAIHSNASGTQPNTTARGTSTFTYSNGRTAAWGTNGPATHPTALQNASDTFGARVQSQFVSDMRANWEATWRNGGHMIMNFGELRECLRMPSALIEIAFHDHATDAGYIRQDHWRRDAARAMYKAIAKDFDPNAIIAPLPPTNFRVEQTGANTYTARWAAVSDPTEATATPTGYKVYRSTNGRSWDDGTAVVGTSANFTATPGEVVFLRVAATNAGGESLPTQALAVRVSGATGHGGALIVYGFDRQFSYKVTDVAGNDDPTNTLNRYRDDYMAAPALALAAYSAKPIYFDSTTNEAVEAGLIDLKTYHAVIWILGEESTADETFSDAEQVRVTDYLENAPHANLFVSGSEIGWDLDNKGSAADRAFYRNELGAIYVADTSNTHSVVGTAGGPFEGLSFTFGNGTSGYYGDYDVAWPDVLAESNGSTIVLHYPNGAGGAATMRTTANGRVLNFGFPFERILGAGNQAAVMSVVADQLMGAYVPPVAAGGGKKRSCAVTHHADSVTAWLMMLLIGACLATRRFAVARH